MLVVVKGSQPTLGIVVSRGLGIIIGHDDGKERIGKETAEHACTDADHYVCARSDAD